MKTKEYQTIARAMLNSKEWKEWYEYQSKDNGNWDVAETAETGWMSEEHWNAFMEYLKDRWVSDTEFKNRLERLKENAIATQNMEEYYHKPCRRWLLSLSVLVFIWMIYAIIK